MQDDVSHVLFPVGSGHAEIIHYRRSYTKSLFCGHIHGWTWYDFDPGRVWPVCGRRMIVTVRMHSIQTDLQVTDPGQKRTVNPI
jgi:hypothetical protein